MDTQPSNAEAIAQTLAVYSKTAPDYAERTRGVDMSKEYAFFLELLPVPVKHARILDAGCGSARDSLAFQKMGAYAMAIDGCPEFVAAARAAQVPAVVKTFGELNWSNAFEGIWAQASLLHLPEKELGEALAALHEALVPGGVICVGMKEGEGTETLPDGRFFRYTNPEDLGNQLRKAGFKEAGWSRVGSRLGADVSWITMRGVKELTPA